MIHIAPIRQSGGKRPQARCRIDSKQPERVLTRRWENPRDDLQTLHRPLASLRHRLPWARRREDVIHRIVQAAIVSFKRRLEADFHRRVGVVIPAQTIEQIDQRIGSCVKVLVESVSKGFEGFDWFDIAQSPISSSLTVTIGD
jgi:hypothetical protein